MKKEILIAENQMQTGKIITGYSREENQSVLRIHKELPMYRETPLIERTEDAKRYQIKALLIKDESKRFGLKAFKGLGGFYALFTVICKILGLDADTATLQMLLSEPYKKRVQELTFITTTDGNHGKGVSWASGIFGCPSYVYMPRGTVEARAQAVRDAGTAKVEILDKTYDECVAFTAKLAEEKGWVLVQDTSWDGYEEIPEFIMKGYTTMLYEALDQMKEKGYTRPTHVFLQAGVGSMAAAVAAGLAQTYSDQIPKIISMEPHGAACIYESVLAGDGNAYTAAGNGITIMAGLNCGTPCSIAWDILKETLSHAISCEDALTTRGMRHLANANKPEERITAGESGAVGTGLVDAILTEQSCREIKEKLELDENSVILLFNTEGDTDPDGYKRATEKPEIRLASEEDLDGIDAIYEKIHTLEEAGKMTVGWERGVYPTRETAREAVLAKDMYVAVVQGEIVASGRINQIQMPQYADIDWKKKVPDNEVCVLHTLVVDPDKSGKGYAKCFLQFYEELAEEEKCSALRIDTNERNRNARAMYQKAGYQERGVIPCAFNGIEGVNLLCLEKEL